MIQSSADAEAGPTPAAPEGPQDAAVALASAPLFSDLAPLDRAKLAAVLEDRWVPAGEVVFQAGGLGDALYVLRSGIAERQVAGTPIGTIVAPEIFGELALLTDEPRSASVVAMTPIRVWVLPRARFHSLVKAEPELLLHLSAAISRRLAQARTALGELQAGVDAWVADRLASLQPLDREVVANAAALDELDPSILGELLQLRPAEATDRLAEVAARSPLIVRDDQDYRLAPVIHRSLRRCLGADLIASRRRRVARVLERRGDVGGALATYLELDELDEAFRVFQSATQTARLALATDRRLPTNWRARLNLPSGEIPVDRRALRRPARARRRPSSRLLGSVAAAAIVGLLWWTPPTDLSPEGWRALVVLIAGAVLLAFDVFPDAIVALAMTAGWVVPGLAPPTTALSGFSSQSWLLVLAVLAVGVAVGSTGLLYRAALVVLTHTPRGFGWRVLVLAAIGTVVTPTLPNATSRMALTAPLVRELAEALGYQPGKRAATGLSMAALIGFGQMPGLFLTGSSVGLLVYGLLPPEVRGRFDFTGWFLAALPVHLPLFVLSLLAVMLWYRPREAGSGIERLALQRAVLGSTSFAEWLSLSVLVGMVAGFLTEPWHGINAAWFGVAALVALVAGGVLDATMLRTGVNWGFLIFFGVITSLSTVFSTLGIDRWLAETLAAPVALLAASPAVFCAGLALAGFALSLVVRWQAAAPLLTLVATPAAAQAGISPFLVGLISLVSTQVWFLPFQSTVYLALYHGSGELFTHRAARRLALLWGPLVLVSLVLAVPVWQWMGLL